MQGKSEPLTNSIQYVKGVGPKRARLFNRLGVNTVEDLLYFVPRRYEDRSHFIEIKALTPDKYQTVKGKVQAMGLRRTYKGLTLFELAIADKTGVIYAIWFNQPYMKDIFSKGQEVILYGKVEISPKLHINTPEYEILLHDNEDTIHTGRIVPIYPLTQQLNQKSTRKIIKYALDNFAVFICDYLNAATRADYNLIDLKEAILNIHFPQSFEKHKQAYRRLVFDDFFLFETALAQKKYENKIQSKKIPHKPLCFLKNKLKNSLAFRLTKSQEEALKQVTQDMTSAKIMNRLLQGDVGSGKTIVAIFALLLTIDNNRQGVIMAPTETLALQHAETLTRLLGPLNINIALLTGNLPANSKGTLLKQISQGQAQIVIGTHALLEEKVKFKNLGLVVIDEQHKFGVAQRLSLQSKGLRPDVLVMTATPIPRTLAMTVYGDLDVTKITELPPGRIPVKTYWITEQKRKDLYKFLYKKIREKKQVYVVYPLIESSQKVDLRDAKRMYEDFKNNIFPDFKIGLIYGSLDKKKRQMIMQDFYQNRLDIIVATTVIEVGIDVPNAAIMLIEHAERFGLSQLHQLRGRVGRGCDESYCILLSDAKTEEAIKRLSAMVSTNDGFKIAEIDLGLRGPGELLGTRQHGIPKFKIANLSKDTEILELARKQAFSLILNDPKLNNIANIGIKQILTQRYPNSLTFSHTC